MKNLEKILKALANRRRLAILKYLRLNREASVKEISDNINLSLRSTSKHLNILAAANITEREQRSTQVFYRLSAEQGDSRKANYFIAMISWNNCNRLHDFL